nr:mechanosensitive ion channel family protein [Clostridiales bacterium]
MFENWTLENFTQKFVDLLPHLILAIVILIVGWIFANAFAKLVIKILKKKEVDSTIFPFIKAVIKLVIKFIVVISALATLGLNINSFLAAIGAAGVTAGIGLKDSVAQFASGIQILLNKPFKNGDFVEIGSNKGVVKGIHLMYTVINTKENKRVIIPNSEI